MQADIAAGRTNALARTSVMTALMCVLGPMSIPIGPVPISLTNFVIYLALYALGARRGVLALLIYLIVGAAGLPVFSGFSGGLGKLVSPTGGYIAGFLPMAMIAGAAIDRYEGRAARAAWTAVGAAVCFTMGTAWFCLQTGTSVAAAASLCVWPFIPGDIAKIIAATEIGPIIRARLERGRGKGRR